MSSEIARSSLENVATKTRDEITATQLNLDLSVLGMGKGKCNWLCYRKVNKNAPVIFDAKEKAFVPAKRSSNAEEQAETVKFIQEIILRKCGGDQEKFDLICRAVKLDPKSSHFATIKQIEKIKFLLED